MVVTFEHFLAGALIVVLMTLHYIVYTRRVALMRRIRQLESLNAALGLRLIRMADIMKTDQSNGRKKELDELKESVHTLFRQYHAGILTIEAMGDVNVGGDVVGRDKKTPPRV